MLVSHRWSYSWVITLPENLEVLDHVQAQAGFELRSGWLFVNENRAGNLIQNHPGATFFSLGFFQQVRMNDQDGLPDPLAS